MDVRDLFPREVRERAATEPFARRDATGLYVRGDDRCVVGALLHEAGYDARDMPSRGEATTLVAPGDDRYGTNWWAVWDVFDALMALNDNGNLRTRESVRAALVPEEAQP